ncbi:MAG: hypothetical protein ACXVP5_03765 [Tumebacillaceae bacterium]
MSELLEAEMRPDVELLLLSWTQMVAVELIVEDEEALAAKAELASMLMSDFGVTDLKLKERTYEFYEVSYREKDEEKTIQFETREVESIYDL